MHKKLSTAFRGAVILSALVAGCNDSPIAPREQSRVTNAVRPTHTEAFTGARADSVLRALDAGWDRGDARRTRLAWRRVNGVPDNIGDPGLPTPIVMQPDPVLLSDGGSSRPAPQVLSHYEALHFGRVDQYTNVPDGVEAEATFSGDQMEIVLGSLTITSNNGSQYQYSGRIAMGPGQFTSCTDILLGTCDSRRHLNGALILSGAPWCDANGNGSVNYYATNLNLAIGITSSSGADASVSANAPIGTAASRCPIADTTQAAPKTSPSDTTSETPTVPEAPGGSPAGPPPVYDGPGVPPPPPSPPRTDGAPEDFWCQTTNTYVYVNGVKTLFTSVIDCHR